ncbi:aminodeoxychorismate lyase [Mesobacillus harenae]|uniref:aminodeoxychorismate lyase n=1 Tax=Mesobacillus harenae TaxID=2213203 RepID=UPI0015810199|nr:aminodeoxychorismate lyase [Mesobacillus harenae]
MYVYINGEVIKKEDVRISPFDHGFLYGLGLFETFRVYEGHPFLLDDHLERLNEGLRLLNIEVQYNRAQVYNILKTLLKKNQLTNAYVRFNVSAGNGEIGLQTDVYTEPNLIIFMKPLLSSLEIAEKEAILLKINRNTPEGSYRLKSHHYLNNVLAKREIGQEPESEGIFLNADGFLAEGIVSNLFWIKDGVLYTPSVNTGILNGITRQFVIRMAKNAGIEVIEGMFLTEQAESADEMFLTNSIQEIVAVSKFGGSQLPGNRGLTVKWFSSNYRMQRRKLWSRNGMLLEGLSEWKKK